MFPSKPVRLIVPYGQLGATDVVAREIAGGLMQRWKKPVFIENLPGAGCVTGTMVALRAPADGHTLLVGTTTNACIAPLVQRGLPYDPSRDLKPLALIGFAPNVLAVYPGVPATDVAMLIEHARAHPGTLRFASAGAGQTIHLLGEIFKAVAHVDILHAPYDQGSATAYDDLLAGRVQMMFDSIIPVREQVAAGALRALAVVSPTRSALLPEVPTMAEAGYAQMNAPIFFGLFAQSAMDSALATHLANEIAAVLPGVHDELARFGLELGAQDAPALQAAMADGARAWQRNLALANIKAV